MNIRIGTEEDKRDIIGKYPHAKQVLGEDGYLVVAEENENIEAFAWAFVQKIPAPIDKIKNRYRWRIIAKCRLNNNVIDIINKSLEEYYKCKFKKTKISISTNPNNMN